MTTDKKSLLEVKSLHLIVIKTPGIETSRRFYELLGMRLQSEQHGSGPRHFSATIQGCVFEIYPLPDGAPPDTSTRLGFSVSDIDVLVEKIRSAGYKIVAKPRSTQWGIRAVVRDPDGRTIELLETLK